MADFNGPDSTDEGTFSIDDLRTSAARIFRGLKIEIGNGETVELRNMLRLSDEERARLLELQGGGDDDFEDQFKQIADIIRILASSKAGAERLIDLIGDDKATLLHVLKTWKKVTQAGEAGPSEG